MNIVMQNNIFEGVSNPNNFDIYSIKFGTKAHIIKPIPEIIQNTENEILIFFFLIDFNIRKTYISEIIIKAIFKVLFIFISFPSDF